jgi:hypothetical protein
MAWTQADLDKVDALLAGNVKSVTFSDGRGVTNQDADKLLAVRREIKAELDAGSARATPRNRAVVGRVCRR